MNRIIDQVPWVGDNIQGHNREPSGQIDTTEGFGAFDDVLKREASGPRIVDVGGGAYDANSTYVGQRYQLHCHVYDPYKRSASHNQDVLKKAKFDTSVSFSVLNVISDEQSRIHHIRLCRDLLKPGRKAIFKVWPGDNTAVGKQTAAGYQNNRPLHTYLDEIQTVFGPKNVSFDPQSQTIRCINPVVRYPSGTYSI